MAESALNGARILVTGGSGFLGARVLERLEATRARETLAPRSAEHDLRDRAASRRLLQQTRPDVVIHLAAVVGGIGANMAAPGRFFYDNASMGIHLIEEARLAGVEKFVCVGTACSYPLDAPLPLRETDIWSGFPEPTNAPYGIAKRMLLTQLQAYRDEYGFNGVYLIPVNLYGPGDKDDLAAGRGDHRSRPGGPDRRADRLRRRSRVGRAEARRPTAALHGHHTRAGVAGI